MRSGERSRRIVLPEAAEAEWNGAMRKAVTMLVLGAAVAVGLAGTPAGGQTPESSAPPSVAAAGPTMLELSVRRQLIQRGFIGVDMSRLSRHEVAMLFLTLNQGSTDPSVRAGIDVILSGCSATIGIPRRPHC